MLYGANVVIFEGILSLVSKDIRDVSRAFYLIMEINLFVFDVKSYLI
jgi:hypothetical protein